MRAIVSPSGIAPACGRNSRAVASCPSLISLIAARASAASTHVPVSRDASAHSRFHWPSESWRTPPGRVIRSSRSIQSPRLWNVRASTDRTPATASRSASSRRGVAVERRGEDPRRRARRGAAARRRARSAPSSSRSPRARSSAPCPRARTAPAARVRPSWRRALAPRRQTASPRAARARACTGARTRRRRTRRDRAASAARDTRPQLDAARHAGSST